MKRHTPVSERTLVQRINGHLTSKGQRLKKLHGDRWRSTLGEYYIADERRYEITRTHVDPVQLAQQLGLLEARDTVHAPAGALVAPRPPGVIKPAPRGRAPQQ
jgi:hypothetical protein